MTTVFADTSYFVALLSPTDVRHAAARAVGDKLRSRLVTTDYVLVELASLFSGTGDRGLFVRVIQALRGDDDVEIVPASSRLFDDGLALYASRADKQWSLTDCVSFVLMKDRGISDALSTDHHFEQAGFRILLS